MLVIVAGLTCRHPSCWAGARAARLAGPDRIHPHRCGAAAASRPRPQVRRPPELSRHDGPHQLCQGPAPPPIRLRPRWWNALEAAPRCCRRHPPENLMQIIGIYKAYAVPIRIFYCADLL